MELKKIGTRVRSDLWRMFETEAFKRELTNQDLMQEILVERYTKTKTPRKVNTKLMTEVEA